MRTSRSEIPAWLELTRDSDSKVRREAVRALCPCEVKSHNREVWLRLLEMAGDPDARVRRGILHVLCDGSPAEYRADILTRLETMRDDPDDRVRKGARRVLAMYRSSGSLNVL